VCQEKTAMTGKSGKEIGRYGGGVKKRRGKGRRKKRRKRLHDGRRVWDERVEEKWVEDWRGGDS